MSKNWEDRSELERTVYTGAHGTPELRRQERRRHLGHFRERLLEAVTWKQLRSEHGQSRIRKALEDPRAVELVIHSHVRSQAMPLIKEAQKQGVDFTVVDNPKYEGKIAVVVAAGEAVDVPRLHSDSEQ